MVSGSDQVLGGTGILSGSHSDISDLNTFTSSIQTEVDAISAATSSYLTSSGSVSFSDITSKPSGLISSSLIAGTNVTLNQEGDSLYISASGGDVTYDGNRTISNDKLGDLFTDTVNPGTSGSVQ